MSMTLNQKKVAMIILAILTMGLSLIWGKIIKNKWVALLVIATLVLGITWGYIAFSPTKIVNSKNEQIVTNSGDIIVW